MNVVLDIFSEFHNIILLSLSILLILTWMFFLVSISKMKKQLKKYKQLTNYTGETSVENILEDFGRRITDIKVKADRNEQEISYIAENLKHYPQYHSIVRFNAFGNTGSDLSFSIALLDDNFDGFVLSSIYGREESITYAKPIEKGLSSYHLTKEEEKAIKLAKDKKELAGK